MTVLEMAPSLMGRQMDESSGEQLKIIASKAGVVIRTGVNVEAIEGDGHVSGVRLKTGEVVSAEALVRWNHPEKGMVSPGFFIPFFEHNGFIIKLDAYIREEVCRNIMELGRRGLNCVPVSVNVSRLEFYDPNLCSRIMDSRC